MKNCYLQIEIYIWKNSDSVCIEIVKKGQTHPRDLDVLDYSILMRRGELKEIELTLS